MKHKQTETEKKHRTKRKPNTTKYVNMPFMSATWRRSVLLPQQISTYKIRFPSSRVQSLSSFLLGVCQQQELLPHLVKELTQHKTGLSVKL